MRNEIILFRRKISKFLRPFSLSLLIAGGCFMFIPKIGVWIKLHFFSTLIPYTDMIGGYCLKIGIPMFIFLLIMETDKQTSEEQAETDAILQSNPDLYTSYNIIGSITQQGDNYSSIITRSLNTDKNGLAQIYHRKAKSHQTSLPYPKILFILGAVILVLTFVFPVTDKILIGTITLRSITFPISIMMMITAFYPALLIWGISLSLVFLTYKTGANTPTGFEWAAVPNSTWIIIAIGIAVIFGIKRRLFSLTKNQSDVFLLW